MISALRKIRKNLLEQGPRSPLHSSQSIFLRRMQKKGRALALHHQEIQLFNEILRADTPLGAGGKRGNQLDKL